METSAQLGGILIAILALMLAFYGIDRTLLQHLVSQTIAVLIAFSGISFFTATTFYLRGTSPHVCLEGLKKLNNKGDIFFASGLLGLLIIPTLLFRVLDLYIAMVACAIATGLVWRHLFFNEDHTGIVAIRLPIFGLIFLDSEKVYKKAHDVELKKWNLVIIVLFYTMISIFIVEGLCNQFLEFSPIGSLLGAMHLI